MIIARHESIPRQTRSQDGSVDNVKGVGDSNEGGDLSSQNQAIIGAVVGVVVVIAITAGILVLLFKKQKWGRIRRREEALLALHAPPAYDNNGDNTSRSSNNNHSRSGFFHTRKHLSSPFPFYQYQISRDIEEQPPAYEHSIPVYDPSRYYQPPPQQHPRPISALTINSGYLHHLTSNPLYGQQGSSQLSMPFRGHRHTIQGGLAMGEMRSSSAMGLGPDHHQETTVLSGSHSSSIPVVGGQGTRPPRKPKPVLSRLITNLG